VITVRLPADLCREIGAPGRLLTPGPATLREVLLGLDREYPGLWSRLVAEGSELRPHIHVFLGEVRLAREGALGLLVPDGRVVFVLRAISGGGS
jgi:hypothetical protein